MMNRFMVCVVVAAGVSLSAGSEPADPAYELTKRTYHVSVAGDKLFAATSVGLTVYSVVDKSKPEIIGYAKVEGSGVSSFLRGNTLFLMEGPAGIFAFDVSDAAKPVQKGTLKLPGAAMMADVRDNMMFVALGSGGVGLVDMTDPAAMKMKTRFGSMGYCGFVRVYKDFVLAGDEDSGLRVFKFNAAKGALEPFKMVELKRRVHGAAIKGETLFLANDTAGIAVVDMKGDRFEKTGSVKTKDTARGVAVAGELLFVADGHGGVRVYDASSPKSIAEKAVLKTEYSTNDIVVDGRFAYVSHDAKGIQVLDISEPLNPKVLGNTK